MRVVTGVEAVNILKNQGVLFTSENMNVAYELVKGKIYHTNNKTGVRESSMLDFDTIKQCEWYVKTSSSVVKVKIKTLEELMDTEGIGVDNGTFYMVDVNEEDRVVFSKTMREYCGKEMELEKMGQDWYVIVKDGLIDCTIQSWMCSEWDDIKSTSKTIASLGRVVIESPYSRVLTLECNNSSVHNLINENRNIYITVENKDFDKKIGMGLTLEEWEKLNKKVKEIIDLKNILKESE